MFPLKSSRFGLDKITLQVLCCVIARTGFVSNDELPDLKNKKILFSLESLSMPRSRSSINVVNRTEDRN